MKTSLLILCQNRLKQKSLLQHQKTSGFTMIELLIGMIMAAVIITPILAFVVDVLQSDRKEGVKAATDQELEAATDFIKRDLSQAIYIYNKTGVEKIKTQLPLAATGEEPILIFWKQDFIPDVIPPLSKYQGTVGPAADSCDQSKDPDNSCDDAQVYSLVAYYLNTEQDEDKKWSTEARITRLQIRDGVKDPNQNFQDYIKNIPEAQKDNGFKPLEFTGSGTLEDKMNNWTSEGAAKITQTKQVLVDYIDKSQGTALDSTYCQQVLGSADVADAQMIRTNNNNEGFFACVDSKRTIAQVNIRGNALVKIQPGATYDPTKPAYFPQKNVIVQGRGSVGQ